MTVPPPSDRYARSTALFRAAAGHLPGGVPAGTTPLLPPGQAPLFFERGRGGRIRDVDGHDYLDFILSYGAVALGHAQPEVNAAAARAASDGVLLSMNHPLQVRFLDAVLGRFPDAGAGLFVKTGSEATTAAVRIARRATGRRTVVRCGYHGWHDWCFPDDGSTPAGLAEQVLPLRDVTPQGLEALLAAHRGRVAAVIVAPEMVLPLDAARLRGLVERTHAHGALFVLDEVKTGFRTPGGSVQRHLGLRPDLTTLAKAMGNGWSVAAVVGRPEVMRAARGLHLSGTYHADAAALAASIATMDLLDRDAVPERLQALGTRLLAGLRAVARRHGVAARAYPEPIAAMPFLAFEDADPALAVAQRTAFHTELYRRGVLMHPTHLWYVCAEHAEADIDHAVEAADAAMVVARNCEPQPRAGFAA